MNLRSRKKRHLAGSVLLVILGVTSILGIGLASYLLLMRWQYASVARSQAWNASLALAEGGVDEALAQLNPAVLLFNTNIDRGANDWTLGADGMYHAPLRTLPDGSYDVAISSDPLPIICATGYVTIPALSATVARSVRVTTTNVAIFRGAMVAIKGVDFKGNNVLTDSFDSMDTNYSTGGLYDSAKRKANGDVFSTEGLINVQNAEVMGSLYTSPDGSYTVGSGGSVGDLNWVLGGTYGLQAGHYKNDFNADFPPVAPPYSTGLPPAGATVAGTNYTWVLGDADYMYTDPSGAKFNSGDIIFVTGRARLYVTGDFIMGAGATMVIAPGASIQLYVGGANAGIGQVNNQGNCATFMYFGLPGNTSINLSGNNSFLGAWYAPSADFKLSGSGTGDIDFQGSCVVNTVNMNGHFRFHFDENLKRNGGIRGYQVTSWTET
jgi:hypothetical protein